MTKRKAAIIGGSGYGGGELLRRLLRHPDVEVARVASIDYVGENVSAAHPNLAGLSGLRFEDLSPLEAARDMDVVFFGLPHTVSAHKVPEVLETGAKVIDLSGDFRLLDVAAYQKFYNAEHPHPDLLGTFVYGLPELNRQKIAESGLIASPGCFATTIELGLLPLAKQGWLEGAVETVAITGSSGSGVRASAGTHHPIRAMNLKTYKTMAHQHTPEIEEVLDGAGARNFHMSFAPVSAPLSRGLFATSFVHVDAAISEDEIRAVYSAFYENEPFVRIPDGRLPEVAAVSGSNFVEVGLSFGDIVAGRRVVACISALDNLIKGGAGQALQSMNITLGLDEMATLEDPGSWP